MAATRDTQDTLILEQPDASGRLRDTQDCLILEAVPSVTGTVRDTQDCLILEAVTQGYGHTRVTQDCLILELKLPTTPVTVSVLTSGRGLNRKARLGG